MTRTDRHTTRSEYRGRTLAVRGALVACLAAAALIADTTSQASATATQANATSTLISHAAGLQTDVDALVAAGAPGALLLVRDGARTTRLAAGLGDIPRKTRMRPGDHFKIASLTKSFTATVVLQLIGEGKLGLDDSIERRLPGVVPNGDEISIRQLLNHTSGLADFEANPRYLKPYLSGNFGHYWSPRQLVRMGVSQKPLFAPGTRHSYSNTNYVVAQLIVEKTTGTALGVELKRRIFAPLRLRGTSYPTKPGLPSPYAHGYRLFGKPPVTDVTGVSPSLAPGSGAIVSTVRDVADFYRALLTGRVLQPDLLKAMKTMVAAGRRDAGAAGYGLGLMRWPTACGSAWGHDGGIAGYWVRSYSTENGRRQVVLMINQDAETLAMPARIAFEKLIAKAYCSAS
jgi:D-alanyl-D-alanine carboxypeptidase